MSLHGEHTGAARRRRLRSFWRHGQMAIQMVLATPLVRRRTGTDHSHQDRGGGEREAQHGRVPGDPLASWSSSASTRKSLAECGQGRSRTLRRRRRLSGTLVEHRIEACPFVLILGAPVPQEGDQLVEACRHLDLPNPEQVIEVPKISSSPRRSRRRRVPPSTQTAEQLVEVPEFVQFAFSAQAADR